MRRALRFLIVWLMAVALPLQALASVTMLHCGPSHERMQGARASVAADAVSPHANGPSLAAVSHDHDGGVVSAGHAASQSGDAAQSENPADPGQYKCSACASCCSIGALPSPALGVPSPAVAPTVFFAVVPTVGVFAAAGPDRPPRIVLA
ncbi:MAG: hypothetical protein Q8R33_00240 [Burkholderiales bacterium]|nr:hypothetical protein [Burkholderiales bacterium]